MKYKTTDKEQRENNFIVVGFGYCEIQRIASLLSANAYTSGVYGWRADFYEFGNRVISTGYNPLTSYTSKTGKKACELIKKDLLRMEKRIKNGKIKSLRGGDWYKAHKIAVRMIERIIEKDIAKAMEEEE